jgi:hypothetical protein
VLKEGIEIEKETFEKAACGKSPFSLDSLSSLAYSAP